METETHARAEAMAMGAKILEETNPLGVDTERANPWAVANGARLGCPAEAVLYPMDATLPVWTEQTGEFNRLVEAGLVAWWPDDDHADPAAVIETTVSEITRMSEGIHSRLKNTAERHWSGSRRATTRTAWLTESGITSCFRHRRKATPVDRIRERAPSHFREASWPSRGAPAHRPAHGCGSSGEQTTGPARRGRRDRAAGIQTREGRRAGPTRRNAATVHRRGASAKST